MSVLGVIPAAGKGSRWGGYYKELLPCGDGEILLTRTVEAMHRGGADAILVISRPDKLAAHAEHLHDAMLPVFYAVQHGDNDIWSAIEESFGYPARRYLFAMPDTYFPQDAFGRRGNGAMSLGVFKTNTPERFGVLVNGHVVNKQRLAPATYDAWGVLSWSDATVRHWHRAQPADYTEAINTAIGAFGLDTWRMAYYVDMASFDDYRGWMEDRA